ncbi:uncharacterized protein TNCV_523411 [Trichonephila clavipes]|nr:uncharacterized protein TNCV_523411 [Trichonephila clavipes]
MSRTDENVIESDIVNFIKIQRIKWAGQVVRVDEDRTTKKVFNAQPVGARGIGRPNLRWIDGLEKVVLVLRTNNWRTLAGRRLIDLEKASREEVLGCNINTVRPELQNFGFHGIAAAYKPNNITTNAKRHRDPETLTNDITFFGAMNQNIQSHNTILKSGIKQSTPVVTGITENIAPPPTKSGFEPPAQIRTWSSQDLDPLDFLGRLQCGGKRYATGSGVPRLISWRESNSTKRIPPLMKKRIRNENFSPQGPSNREWRVLARSGSLARGNVDRRSLDLASLLICTSASVPALTQTQTAQKTVSLTARSEKKGLFGLKKKEFLRVVLILRNTMMEWK